LSNLYFDVKTVYNNDNDNDNDNNNIDLIIENKIKKLLELTETETTQTS
jgi:hypothetical protein